VRKNPKFEIRNPKANGARKGLHAGGKWFPEPGVDGVDGVDLVDAKMEKLLIF
jgi:hypothetical protein